MITSSRACFRSTNHLHAVQSLTVVLKLVKKTRSILKFRWTGLLRICYLLKESLRKISASIVNCTEIQYFEVLGDLIKSIVGAILVDSEFNTITVWTAMKLLLDPVVTAKSIRYHPIHEFTNPVSIGVSV